MENLNTVREGVYADVDKSHNEIGRIMATKDVDFFKIHHDNRKISKSHVKKIKKSIRQVGLLDPIKVSTDGYILNGQHRFCAIKELQEEGVFENIKYIIINDMDEREAIITLNSIQKELSITDYLEIYAKNGNKQYQKILDLADEYGQSVGAVVTIISCGSGFAHSKFKEDIKAGKDISFDEWEVLYDYFEWLNKLNEYVHLKSKTKEMLFRLYQYENFLPEIFLEKAEREFVFKNAKLKFSTSQNICKKQIIDVYNKGQKKVNGSNRYIDYYMDADGKIFLR